MEQQTLSQKNEIESLSRTDESSEEQFRAFILEESVCCSIIAKPDSNFESMPYSTSAMRRRYAVSLSFRCFLSCSMLFLRVSISLMRAAVSTLSFVGNSPLKDEMPDSSAPHR